MGKTPISGYPVRTRITSPHPKPGLRDKTPDRCFAAFSPIDLSIFLFTVNSMFQKYGKWKKIKEINAFLVCLRSDLSPVSSKSIPVKKERWQVLTGGLLLATCPPFRQSAWLRPSERTVLKCTNLIFKFISIVRKR